MAFPTYVDSGTIVKSTTGGTPGLPAGVQDDDVLLLTVMTANQAVSTPTGWTLVAGTGTGLGTAGQTTAVRLTAFWRRMAPGVSAPTVADPGDVCYAVIRAFRGCVTTGDPWDFATYATAASATAVSMTTGTTLGADRLLYHCVANTTDTNAAQIAFGTWSNANLANFADLGGDNTNQGTGGGLSHVSAEKATAGACGTTTATLGTASAQAKLVIAFKPLVVQQLQRTVTDTITTVSESVERFITFVRSTLDQAYTGGGAATPAYASHTNHDNASSVSQVGDLPSGTVDGDLLIAHLALDDPLITVSTVPTGWTAIPNGTVAGGTDTKIATYYRVCDGSEPASWTWTISEAAPASVSIVRYTGVDESDPIPASNSAAIVSGTSHASPSITPPVDGCLIVGFANVDKSATQTPYWTPPATYAERYDFEAPSSFLESTSADKQQVTAAPVSVTFTSNDGDEGVVAIVALRPAGGGGISDSIVATVLSIIMRTVSDTTSVSESVSRAAISFVRSFTDTITTVSESVDRIKVMPRITSDTITTVSESVARVANKVRTTADTTSVSDSVARIANKIRTVVDTVTTVTDSVFRGTIIKVRTALDTTTLSEGVNRAAISFVRTSSDTITTVSESVVRGFQIARTATDTVLLGLDSIVATVERILVRTVSDTVSIGADSVGRAVTMARTLSESLSVSDSLVRLVTLPRTLVDSVATSDTLSRLLTMVRNLSDTTSLTESVSRAALTFVRATADTTTSVTDSIAHLAGKLRTAADTTIVSDSISRAWQGARSLADTLPAISDTAVGSAALLLLRFTTDSLTSVTDSVARTLQMVRGPIDTLVTSDTVVKVANYARTIQDSIPSVTDLVVRGGVIVRRTVEDAVAFVSDIVVFAMGIPKFVGEIVRIAKSRNIFRVGRNDRDSIVGHSNKHEVRDD